MTQPCRRRIDVSEILGSRFEIPCLGMLACRGFGYCMHVLISEAAFHVFLFVPLFSPLLFPHLYTCTILTLSSATIMIIVIVMLSPPFPTLASASSVERISASRSEPRPPVAEISDHRAQPMPALSPLQLAARSFSLFARLSILSSCRNAVHHPLYT